MTTPAPIVYTDRLVGWTGVLITLAVGLVVGVVGWMVQSPVSLSAIVLAPVVACAVMISTLTIEVSKERACWYFTFGVFRRCVLLSDILDVRAAEIVPFGWGYRIEGQRKAWVASGKQFVVMRMTNGEQLSVNVRNPEAVAAALQSNMPSGANEEWRS